jgi:hypothetical protein
MAKPQLRDAHFVVLGTIADKPGSTPEDVARLLGLDIDEVLRLLGDLDAAAMVTPGNSAVLLGLLEPSFDASVELYLDH